MLLCFGWGFTFIGKIKVKRHMKVWKGGKRRTQTEKMSSSEPTASKTYLIFLYYRMASKGKLRGFFSDGRKYKLYNTTGTEFMWN